MCSWSQSVPLASISSSEDTAIVLTSLKHGHPPILPRINSELEAAREKIRSLEMELEKLRRPCLAIVLRATMCQKGSPFTDIFNDVLNNKHGWDQIEELNVAIHARICNIVDTEKDRNVYRSACKLWFEIDTKIKKYV